MTTDQIINCALARNSNGLRGADSNAVVDALNKLKCIGGRKERAAMVWLRDAFQKERMK